MSIPLSNTIVQNAAAYSAPTTAFASPLCKTPKEGFRAVPMQFIFVNNYNWLVDLGVGQPNPLISQCCALYIDAISSSQNCTIAFPDSGYQVQVASGRSLLCPVLSGFVLPKFYVYVPNTNSTDIVNVFALNQFVPEFSAP